MKKRFLCILCLCLLSAPLFAQMTKTELQNMYLAYLSGRNITASVDSDGDIAFQYKLPTYNAMSFFIIVNEDDQEFFRIVVPNLYTIDTNSKAMAAPVAASHATRSADVIKMYLNSAGTNVTASAEIYVAAPSNFRFAFPKMMLQFEVAFDEFLAQMR